MQRVVGVFLFIVLLTGVASADILFNTASGAGGTLSWAGDNAPLIGASIGMAGVTGSGVPQNSGFHFITGSLPGCYYPTSCGDLEFTTGSYLGVVVGAMGQNILEFNPGGSFILTGAVQGTTMDSSSFLLSGQFTGITTLDTQTGWFTGTTGSGLVTVGSSLLSYFGIDSIVPFQFTAQVLSGGMSQNVLSAFSRPVNSVQINSSPVPEPASIVLLSVVLLGCTTILRRRAR